MFLNLSFHLWDFHGVLTQIKLVSCQNNLELFNKQCDLCDCRVFYKVCIVWYLEKLFDFFSLNPLEALPSSICWFVSFVTNNFAGYMKKSTRAIIYHAICEIFYINTIPKFCIAGGWCCHKKCVFQLLSSFFNPCPHLTILILWWPRRL